MKFVTLPNGNLQFQLEDSDDKLLIEDLLARDGENDIALMADILEETGWQPNGYLMLLKPEDVAALTGAPILTDDGVYEEDGSITVHETSKVWWYPDYQVLNFARELLKDGRVTFMAAEPVREESVAT